MNTIIFACCSRITSADPIRDSQMELTESFLLSLSDRISPIISLSLASSF